MAKTAVIFGINRRRTCHPKLGVMKMPKGVKCLVEECVFYHNEDCTAESIEVASNGNDIVGTSKGTLCATFRFRDFDDGHIEHQPGTHA